MKTIAKKSWSNFLKDKDIIEKIVNLANIKDNSVIEIGPGTGNLTKFILKNKPKKFIVIEKDKNLALNLKKILKIK